MQFVKKNKKKYKIIVAKISWWWSWWRCCLGCLGVVGLVKNKHYESLRMWTVTKKKFDFFCASKNSSKRTRYIEWMRKRKRKINIRLMYPPFFFFSIPFSSFFIRILFFQFFFMCVAYLFIRDALELKPMKIEKNKIQWHDRILKKWKKILNLRKKNPRIVTTITT